MPVTGPRFRLRASGSHDAVRHPVAAQKIVAGCPALQCVVAEDVNHRFVKRSLLPCEQITSGRRLEPRRPGRRRPGLDTARAQRVGHTGRAGSCNVRILLTTIGHFNDILAICGTGTPARAPDSRVQR